MEQRAEYTYDVEAFRNSFEHNFKWLDGFRRNVMRYARKTALFDNASKKSWTYQQLDSDVNKLAHALLADGLKRNDVVMYMLFNSPEFIFCHLAGHKTGIINCPINYRMAPGELALLLEDSKPALFVYDSWTAETVRDAFKYTSYRPERLVVVGSGAKAFADDTPFEDYVASQPDTEPQLQWPQTIYDETTRLYTSGTTSLPKAVPMNSLNELLTAHDVIMHYPLNAEDRTLNLTPWFHRGGLQIGGPGPTFYVGGAVIIMREFKPRAALDLIHEQQVTYMTAVPSIFALLGRAQRADPVNMDSLRGICSMGSPLSKAALLEYRGLFSPRILNGYGTSETFVNVFMRPLSPLEKCSATGQSCIDDDVRLVRIKKEGKAEPTDLVPMDGKTTGEIIIRAPNKSVGMYINNPEMTEKKFYKDYHYTGDIGVWDEDGYITVLCRKDDMIICSGENIYPSQIEAALNEHPDVAESAVVGRPDKRHGESVIAYVVAKNDNLAEAELRSWCARHPMLPAYKRPKRYFLVNELPHTANGKLMHYKLREFAKSDAPN